MGLLLSACPCFWLEACAHALFAVGFKYVLTNECGVCAKLLGRSRVCPRVVEKPASVPNAFSGGEAFPVRTRLSSQNRSIHYQIHTFAV